MRSRLTLPLVLALVLGTLPAVVRADDSPAAGEDATQPPEKPSDAWAKINAQARTLRYPQNRAAVKSGAQAYLAAFEKRGAMALGAEALSLGYLQRAAEQWRAASVSFRSVWANAENASDLRDEAAVAAAQLLGNDTLREGLGAPACAATVRALLDYAGAMGEEARGERRSAIETALASVLDDAHEPDKAFDLRIAVIKRDPDQTARLYRSLTHGLLARTHAMEGYDALRVEARSVKELLLAQQARALETAQARLATTMAKLKEASPESVTPEGGLVAKPVGQQTELERQASGAQRSVSSAESTLKGLEKFDQPFGMLGQPAPAWALEHAFGGVQSLGDLRGKVVVMDFWATWCPWCIRSFPAIRDLLRDYQDKGLVVVGVTASASSVYAARYDLDDDLKDQAEPGVRVQAAARLVRTGQTPDGETVFSAEDYPAKEKEVITTFIENHQMTWPVVMIDKAEPAPKYALTGWPHAVILDREGRVRSFKSGALLRDRPEDVKKFRALLEELLAEPAPKAR